MGRRFAVLAAFVVIALGVGGAAHAQSIPEGQSCGGLLCDLGVFGHKTAPSASPEPAPPLPARSAETVPTPVPPPAIAADQSTRPVSSPSPRKRVVSKKRPTAKVATIPSAPVPAAPAPAASTPAIATAPLSGPGLSVAAPTPRVAPQPAPFIFQPIYQ